MQFPKQVKGHKKQKNPNWDRIIDEYSLWFFYIDTCFGKDCFIKKRDVSTKKTSLLVIYELSEHFLVACINNHTPVFLKSQFIITILYVTKIGVTIPKSLQCQNVC